MVENILDVTNDEGRHFQQVDIFFKAFNFLAQCTHFSFQTGPLVDELLRFFSEVGIRLFKGAEVIIRIVGQITIGAFYIRTHAYQFNQKPTVYKVCVVWACLLMATKGSKSVTKSSFPWANVNSVEQ